MTGVSVKSIKKSNNLLSDVILPGQRLVLPVQDKDKLMKINEANKEKDEKIMEYNEEKEREERVSLEK